MCRRSPIALINPRPVSRVCRCVLFAAAFFSVGSSRTQSAPTSHAPRRASIRQACGNVPAEWPQRGEGERAFAHVEQSGKASAKERIERDAQREPLAGVEGAQALGLLGTAPRLSGGPLCRSARRSGDWRTAHAAMGPWQSFMNRLRRAAAFNSLKSLYFLLVPRDCGEAAA
jgi:hypothetical protein